MSQLIRMRQRIKAIKTIKKITHALRLISMSTHLRLRSKKATLEAYRATLSSLFLDLVAMVPSWKNPMVSDPERKLSGSSLVILIGSQKGLCGNFNTELYAFFQEEVSQKESQPLHIITVGKKAHDYVNLSRDTLEASFDDFSMTTIEKVSHALAQFILENSEKYSSITVYANTAKSFFVQKPHAVQVIPFTFESSVPSEGFVADDYIWEQQPTEILDFLVEKLIQVTIHELLFQSLLAEQAARFIAMDNSTRSASKLLESMQLLYNKMRQSKITGELTDLIGGFF